jgi:hypothetical protein
MHGRHFPIVLALASLLLGACASEEADEGTLAEATYSWNNLSPDDELAARPNTRSLVVSLFKQSPLTATMYDTAAGKYTLIKAALCGLPLGTSVTITNNSGVSRPFDGLIGLIPYWTTGVPKPSDSNWFWGCLAAHVNAKSKAVDISLRGDHPAYTVTAQEKKDYTFQEAVWYGDSYQLYAAVGMDVSRVCTITAVKSLQDRVCARGAGCPNIIVTGLASTMCSTYVDGHWSGCTGGGKKYAEVTTNYLKANTIYECSPH